MDSNLSFRKWKLGQWRYQVLAHLEKLTLKSYMITNETECPIGFRKAVQTELKKNKYDIYFSNYAKMTPIRGVSFSGLKICDTHDLQSRRIENELKKKQSNKILRKIHTLLYRWSERVSLGKFDKLIAISSTEMGAMKKMVGDGVDVVYAPASFDQPRDRPLKSLSIMDILFVGSNSSPNIDGLLWFLRHVFPIVLSVYPNATLTVVGRICLNKAIASAANALPFNVKLEGFVEEIDDLYRQTRIVICPIRYGTGMKIKTVEALSNGCVIVGTPTAFESIKAQNGVDAVIADQVDIFAESIVRLLGDETLCENMSESAHRLYVRDHSFEAFTQTMKSLLHLPV